MTNDSVLKNGKDIFKIYIIIEDAPKSPDKDFLGRFFYHHCEIFSFNYIDMMI